MTQQCDRRKWGEIECQCLQAHNQYRHMHSAAPLTLNKNLNKTATNWAKKLAKEGEMQHSTAPKYGENLYFCSGILKITGDMAVKPWYNEINQYDFEKAEFSANTGHFTQLVWKDTKEFGVGYAKKGNKFLLVCHYNPPGNVVGKFKENVLPRVNT